MSRKTSFQPWKPSCKSTSELDLAYEVLIIDDHSTDATVDVIRSFQEKHPELPIRLLTSPRRRGLGYNYVEGAFQGHGAYYMLVNGDHAEPYETLFAILSRLGEAEMIIPWFGNRDTRNSTRRWVSLVFTWLVNRASGNRIHYYNGPVLHLRYNVMRWHPDTQGYAYQAELVCRLLEQGFRYAEVQVQNQDREAGASKAFSMKNILSVSHSLLQILLRRIRCLLFPR